VSDRFFFFFARRRVVISLFFFAVSVALSLLASIAVWDLNIAKLSSSIYTGS